jgi:hypothetical protein
MDGPTQQLAHTPYHRKKKKKIEMHGTAHQIWVGGVTLYGPLAQSLEWSCCLFPQVSSASALQVKPLKTLT